MQDAGLLVTLLLAAALGGGYRRSYPEMLT